MTNINLWIVENMKLSVRKKSNHILDLDKCEWIKLFYGEVKTFKC